jgi:hypothetical protein
MEEVERYLNAMVSSEFFLGYEKTLVKAKKAKGREERATV